MDIIIFSIVSQMKKLLSLVFILLCISVLFGKFSIIQTVPPPHCFQAMVMIILNADRVLPIQKPEKSYKSFVRHAVIPKYASWELVLKFVETGMQVEEKAVMTTTVLQMMDAISASLNQDIYVKDHHQYVFQHVEMELEKALNFVMGRVTVGRTVNQFQMLSFVELLLYMTE